MKQSSAALASYSCTPLDDEVYLEQGIRIRDVSQGQKIYANIWKKNNNKEDPASRMRLLCAAARWIYYRLSMLHYGKKVGAHPLFLRPLEQKTVSLHTSKSRIAISGVLQAWERDKVVPDALREEVLEQIAAILGGTTGFYRMMQCDKGSDDFCEAVGISTNALERRERFGLIPEYTEVRSVITSLYSENKLRMSKRLHQAQTVWRDEKQGAFEKRGIEKPLAILMSELEIWLGDRGLALTADNLHKQIGPTPGQAPNLKYHDALALINAVFLSWQVIGPLARKIGLTELQSQWQECEEAEKNRPTFPKQLRLCLRENGIISARLLRALDIRRQRSRRRPKQDIDDDDSRPSHPSLALQRLMMDGTSTQACPRTVVELIAQDDEELQHLRTMFFTDRIRFHTRAGYTGDTVLKVTKEWNGVPNYRPVAALIDGTEEQSVLTRRAKELQLIESRALDPDGIRPQIVRSLNRIGREKTNQARGRWAHSASELPSAYRAFTTVPEMLRQFSVGCGTFEHLMEIFRQYCDENDVELLRGESSLRALIKGKGPYPPLPIIRNMLDVFGLLLKDLPELELDWHNQFPQHLADRYPRLKTNPLQRVVRTIIARSTVDLRQFQSERLPQSGSCPGLLSNRITHILVEQNPVSWRVIEEILLAADLQPDSLIWRLASALFAHQNDVTGALLSVNVPRQQRTPYYLIGLLPIEISAAYGNKE